MDTIERVGSLIIDMQHDPFSASIAAGVTAAVIVVSFFCSLGRKRRP